MVCSGDVLIIQDPLDVERGERGSPSEAGLCVLAGEGGITSAHEGQRVEVGPSHVWERDACIHPLKGGSWRWGGGVAKGSSGISENKSIDFSDTEKLSLLGM